MWNASERRTFACTECRRKCISWRGISFTTAYAEMRRLFVYPSQLNVNHCVFIVFGMQMIHVPIVICSRNIPPNNGNESLAFPWFIAACWFLLFSLDSLHIQNMMVCVYSLLGSSCSLIRQPISINCHSFTSTILHLAGFAFLFVPNGVLHTNVVEHPWAMANLVSYAWLSQTMRIC